MNRGSNGNKDMVLPRVVSCGGEPIPMKVERKSLILYTYIEVYVRTIFRYVSSIHRYRGAATNVSQKLKYPFNIPRGSDFFQQCQFLSLSANRVQTNRD